MNTNRDLLFLIMLTAFVFPLAVGVDSFTLQICGNADMDETINDQDVAYTEKIIKGEAEKTILSDANNDGSVDEKDIDQINKIIAGDEEFLVVRQDLGDFVKIAEPVKTFVYHGHNTYVYETLRAIQAADGIVGITDSFVTPGGSRISKAYLPELLSVTNVGSLQAINYEVINNIKPDIVLTDAREYYDPTKTPDIPVLALDVNVTNGKEASLRYGYIFDKDAEAEEYVNWYTDIENKITERISKVADSEKPLMYISNYNLDKTTFQVPAKDNYRAVMVRNAGAKYIGDEMEGSGIQNVDAEWVIARNPQVIAFSVSNMIMGYDIHDTTNATAAIDDFLQRPAFADIDAVKNNKVYLISHPYILCGGASGLIGTLYYSKWLYPDLFADVDVQEIQQEYISRFQHLDLNVKDSISAYPQ
ncbi:MAG: Periplasmic binding protein [Euryarchaeota archaeon]|nr:Periplasmic binding protein [Euryarchaeota archaeon]